MTHRRAEATSERARRTTPSERGSLDTVVVTGLSGAGRSTAAKCLEDLGYFVVDNLPPELIATHGRPRQPHARARSPASRS